MIQAINTKVLVSGAVILAAAALIIGGTFAFFSDTETSVNNTLVAGAIDLKIDNESYAVDYNVPNFQGTPTGALVFSGATSWDSKDLTTADQFFNFTDLKPGDKAEDTISVRVGSNPAWLCAAARVTDNSDESCTSPEKIDDPSCGIGDPTTNGDLASRVNFVFWKDDGDNVFETGETPFLTGPISGIGAGGKIALVDSQGGPLGPSPVPGNATSYIGKAWCFGTLGTANPVAQDGLGKTGTNGPLVRGTGITCDGSAENNAAQTDKVVGDLQFYAVQSRNNGTFTCASNYTPVWNSPPTPTPTIGG